MILIDYAKIVVEVGANNGSDTAKFSSRDDFFVFAFEPNPLLYTEVQAKFSNHKNVIILPFAIDIVNGFTTFNISDAGDRGTSSLYDYHDNLKTNDIGKHPVFQSGWARTQMVTTLRLDTFMDIWDIPRIDYLHVDAQGNDFRVIQSLGDRIKDVRGGRCECTYKNPLYKDADVINDHEECSEYLRERGFGVNVAYIHDNDTEIDLEFIRS
jgi:FkbM family methyltransferase